VQVHATVDIPQAFVATSGDITKLWHVLAEPCPVFAATAHCHDGLVRQFATLEGLVGYENPGRASITSLELSAMSADRETTAQISLGTRYSTSMTASLHGEEACISSLRTSLTDILDGMRPWYSRIATVELFYVWVPIFAFPYLLIQILGASSPSSSKMEIPFRTAVYLTAVVVGELAAIGLVIWGTSRLRSRFFPVSTFAIGQGAGRHQRDEQIRWVVIVGFLVNVAAGIFLATMLAA
jgi:hypothetical protein